MKQSVVYVVAGLLAFGAVAGTVAINPGSGLEQTGEAAATGNASLVRVKGKGTGATKAEALKDAYRDAVERAVGLFVDSEQLLQNDKLIQDQVLTASNAYIEKYECVKTTVKSGLTFVEIVATVRRGALTRRVNALMPAQRVDLSAANPNVHAQVVTELQRTGDSLALLKNELKDLNPLTKLMKVTLASNQPVIERVEGDESQVRLWYPMSVSVDTERYYQEFVPRMDRILDQIKTAGPERFELRHIPEISQSYETMLVNEFGKTRKGIRGVMTRSDEVLKNNERSPLLVYGLALNEKYQDVRFFGGKLRGENLVVSGFDEIYSDRFIKAVCEKLYNDRNEYMKRYRQIRREFLRQSVWSYTTGCRHDPLPEGGAYYVAIVKKSTGKNSTISGTVYQVSYGCAAAISTWQDKTCMGKCGRMGEHDATAPKTEFTLRFTDRQNEEVVGTSVELMNFYLSNIACVTLKLPTRVVRDGRDWYKDGGVQMSLITPLVGGFASSYVKWVSVTLPKDDVLKITSVEF